METLRDRMEADLKIGGYSPSTRSPTCSVGDSDGDRTQVGQPSDARALGYRPLYTIWRRGRGFKSGSHVNTDPAQSPARGTARLSPTM